MTELLIFAAIVAPAAWASRRAPEGDGDGVFLFALVLDIGAAAALASAWGQLASWMGW